MEAISGGVDDFSKDTRILTAILVETTRWDPGALRADTGGGANEVGGGTGLPGGQWGASKEAEFVGGHNKSRWQEKVSW